MLNKVLAQPDSLITFDWGAEGLAALGPTVRAIVIVDVLRFTTCVSVACSRGAVVLPYEWNDASVDDYATRHRALVAGRRRESPSAWSLSPTDLLAIPTGTRLVLPSPNGSALSFRAAEFGAMTIAGSLRNASAVARVLATHVEAGERVAVIAAGERWESAGINVVDAPLRPAIEDLLGAGAVIAAVLAILSKQPRDSSCGRVQAQMQERTELERIAPELASPEALAAAAALRDALPNIESTLRRCSSGRELIERGWTDDVVTASMLDADDCVPELQHGEYACQV